MPIIGENKPKALNEESNWNEANREVLGID
jgi:hypothetical protein